MCERSNMASWRKCGRYLCVSGYCCSTVLHMCDIVGMTTGSIDTQESQSDQLNGVMVIPHSAPTWYSCQDGSVWTCQDQACVDRFEVGGCTHTQTYMYMYSVTHTCTHEDNNALAQSLVKGKESSDMQLSLGWSYMYMHMHTSSWYWKERNSEKQTLW